MSRNYHPNSTFTDAEYDARVSAAQADQEYFAPKIAALRRQGREGMEMFRQAEEARDIAAQYGFTDAARLERIANLDFDTLLWKAAVKISDPEKRFWHQERIEALHLATVALARQLVKHLPR